MHNGNFNTTITKFGTIWRGIYLFAITTFPWLLIVIMNFNIQCLLTSRCWTLSTCLYSWMYKLLISNRQNSVVETEPFQSLFRWWTLKIVVVFLNRIRSIYSELSDFGFDKNSLAGREIYLNFIHYSVWDAALFVILQRLFRRT